MLTEKDYCDYETCVALKELGYNGTAGECSHFGAFHMNGKEIFYDRLYNSELKENECLRVPLYLAQKWLREEKGILLQPTYLELSDEWICVLRDKNKRHGYSAQKQKHYEEALSEGLRTSIKILRDE